MSRSMFWLLVGFAIVVIVVAMLLERRRVGDVQMRAWSCGYAMGRAEISDTPANKSGVLEACDGVHIDQIAR